MRSVIKPEQRTKEWYTFRHELITASNLWKIFGTDAQYNSLIYEKCLPLKLDENNTNSSVNILSPLHWGQKYEPLSVMIYEEKYNTKIEDLVVYNIILINLSEHLQMELMWIKQIINMEECLK